MRKESRVSWFGVVVVGLLMLHPKCHGQNVGNTNRGRQIEYGTPDYSHNHVSFNILYTTLQPMQVWTNADKPKKYRGADHIKWDGTLSSLYDSLLLLSIGTELKNEADSGKYIFKLMALSVASWLRYMTMIQLSDSIFQNTYGNPDMIGEDDITKVYLHYYTKFEQTEVGRIPMATSISIAFVFHSGRVVSYFAKGEKSSYPGVRTISKVDIVGIGQRPIRFSRFYYKNIHSSKLLSTVFSEERNGSKNMNWDSTLQDSSIIVSIDYSSPSAFPDALMTGYDNYNINRYTGRNKAFKILYTNTRAQMGKGVSEEGRSRARMLFNFLPSLAFPCPE